MGEGRKAGRGGGGGSRKAQPDIGQKEMFKTLERYENDFVSGEREKGVMHGSYYDASKGWPAYTHRGEGDLDARLAIGREHAETEHVNFIVAGGSPLIQRWCRENQAQFVPTYHSRKDA